MQYKKPETFKAIEEFINDYADTFGMAPTVRDISNGVGLARSSVSSYLQAMKERGDIAYDEHRRPLTRMTQNQHKEEIIPLDYIFSATVNAAVSRNPLDGRDSQMQRMVQ